MDSGGSPASHAGGQGFKSPPHVPEEEGEHPLVVVERARVLDSLAEVLDVLPSRFERSFLFLPVFILKEAARVSKNPILGAKR